MRGVGCPPRGHALLIRHGQASYGQADYDRLSTRGEDQARAVGRWLAGRELSALYTGPLRRQIQTGAFATEAASALGRPLPTPTELLELAEYPAFEMLQHLVPRLVAEDPEFEALKRRPAPACSTRRSTRSSRSGRVTSGGSTASSG